MPRALLNQTISADNNNTGVVQRRGLDGARETYSGRRAALLTPNDLIAARIAGYELPDGEDAEYLIGRDPRRMSQDELLAIGHEAKSPMMAIRANCLDCCAGSHSEVRKCVAVSCACWPFRMGKNPWRTPLSDAQREQRRQVALRNAFGSNRNARGTLETDEDVSGEVQ